MYIKLTNIIPIYSRNLEFDDALINFKNLNNFYWIFFPNTDFLRFSHQNRIFILSNRYN